ncbi:hypothetical protein HY624_02805 [Candidatus Uhrbacteria bacterium]|nr:hypothetical protein [Candidatus Uhrbacteria bacterium]
MRTTFSYVILFFLVLIVGCGNVAKGRLKQPTPKPSSTPLVSTVIGVAGGTMSYHNPSSLYNNLEVIIPPGATTGSMTVAATIPTSAVVDPIPSLPLDLGPSRATFLVPVTLRIPYNPALIEPGDDPNDLVVVTRDLNGAIEIIQGATIDVATHTATISVTHFSPFVILFPRHYKLYRQPYRFIDGTPVEYAMGITYAPQGTGVVKVYHPMIASNLSGRTLVLGKGTEQDFANTSQGNVIALHGVFGSSADFAFDAGGMPNSHDIRTVLQNNPKVRNLLFFEYQSGRSVDENAFAFANLFLQLVKPGCKCTIIGFSMGGVVARTAREKFGISQYVDGIITLGSPHEGGSLHNATDYFAQYNATKAIVAGTIAGLGDIMIGSQFLTALNGTYQPQNNPTPYYLVAANARDQNGNLLGHDGFVDTWSAQAAVLGVPTNRILTIYGAWHGDLHMNADTNGVGKQTIAWIPGPNTQPTADAGPDAVGSTGYPVTLDGMKSYDLDLEPLTYQWTQQGGTPVTLTQSTSATPTWTPPSAGVYPFALVVNDGKQDSLADTVTITVTDPRQVTVFVFRDSFDARNNPQYNAANPTRADWEELFVGVDTNGTIFDATLEYGLPVTAIPIGSMILSAKLELNAKMISGSGMITVTDRSGSPTVPATVVSTATQVFIDCRAIVQAHIGQSSWGGSPSSTWIVGLESTSAYVKYHSGDTKTSLDPRLRIVYR